MIVGQVEFTGSFPSVDQCPDEQLPEYAFIGRSNVGKSSLINMICGRRDIARVSRTPGKTRLLNYFKVDGKWNIVDLPGYGYAVVSKVERRSFRKMIYDYLETRTVLQCTFVLVDSGVKPQKIDLDFINWLGKTEIPFALIFTKADKTKKREPEQNREDFLAEMLKSWSELPPVFISSSVKKTGRKYILEFINSINEDFYDRKPGK